MKLGTSNDKKELSKQYNELYLNFQGNYYTYIGITLSQVTKNVASIYPTEDFFAKRFTVQQSIVDQLIEELLPRHFAITSALIIGVRYTTKVKVNMQYRETSNQYIEGLKHKVKTSVIKAKTMIAVAKIKAKTKTEEVRVKFILFRLKLIRKHT